MNRNSPILLRIRSESVLRVARNFLGMEKFSWVALVFTALFFCGAGWLPDGLAAMVFSSEDWRTGLIQFSLALVVFVFFGFLLHREIRKANRIRVVVAVPPSARVLSVFLSSLGRFKEAERRLLEEGAAFPEITREFLSSTCWHMPLTAIGHHAERLEAIHVITSAGDTGSSCQYPLFREITERFFPGIPMEEMKDGGVDFEDIAAVHDLIDRFYDRVDASPVRYEPNDVIVDITGGQKPNSIAAAMATLAEGRRFQYVSTRDGSVYSYDLVQVSAENEG